ncbi:MAG: indole-3-glycerol phosphate synthase TrpC [Clostridiales Family XIII bacterium]|jgi:indole-3-glycerol phosphate synthase|nr:indole-3-glycerol phosphate synthase TrpC [Clostridiales Family XIII bacterium]
MTTILDKLAESTRARVAREKARVGPEEMRAAALAVAATNAGGRSFWVSPAARFEAALAKPGMSFICEVKKASPSKGVIAEDFPYLEIARAYEAAGADVVSVLTEPEYFLGSIDYLREIAAAVRTPILRKDFIIDTYQIDQARAAGASAVLLITSLLGDKLGAFIAAARAAGLGALVEIHDESEAVCAIEAGAAVVGVNNRDLKTFEVDASRSARLRGLIPEGILFVAESGIRTADDVREALAARADAVLVGEHLMRAENKAAALSALRSKTTGDEAKGEADED